MSVITYLCKLGMHRKCHNEKCQCPCHEQDPYGRIR